MGNFKENCKFCGDIISQCRCPNPNKEQRWGICQKCSENKTPDDCMTAQEETPPIEAYENDL